MKFIALIGLVAAIHRKPRISEAGPTDGAGRPIYDADGDGGSNEDDDGDDDYDDEDGRTTRRRTVLMMVMMMICHPHSPPVVLLRGGGKDSSHRQTKRCDKSVEHVGGKPVSNV